MSRIDNLPDNTLVAELQRLETELTELKNKQTAAGSSLVVKVTTTSSTTPNADSGYQSFTLGAFATTTSQVRFNTTNQDYAYKDITYRVFVDSPTSEVFPGNALYPARIVLDERLAGTPVPKQLRWFLQLSGNTGSHTYYLRFYVQSSDTGVFV